jgi:hypothetical protein
VAASWLAKLASLFATRRAVEPVLVACEAKTAYDVVATSRERRLTMAG